MAGVLSGEISRPRLATSQLIWSATGLGYVIFAAITLTAAATGLTAGWRGWLLAGCLVLAAIWHRRMAPPQVGTAANHASIVVLWGLVALAFFCAQPGGGLAAGGAMFIGPLVAIRLQDRRQIAAHLAAASAACLGVAALGVLGSVVDPYTVLAAGFAAFAAPVQGFSCAMIFEATEAQQAELAALVRRDALTGVGNRRLLDERLDDAVAIGRRTGRGFTLLGIDLGDVAAHGDPEAQHDHEELLRQAGAALLRAADPADTVARVERDRFLIVTTAASVEQARPAINAARAHLGALARADGSPVAPRIAAASYPEDAEDVAVLLDVVDRRLQAEAATAADVVAPGLDERRGDRA